MMERVWEHHGRKGVKEIWRTIADALRTRGMLDCKWDQCRRRYCVLVDEADNEEKTWQFRSGTAEEYGHLQQHLITCCQEELAGQSVGFIG